MNEVFLKTPNLPDNRVTLVSVSEGNDEIVSSLNSLGIKSIIIQSAPNLPPPVSNHSDMNFCYVGNSAFFVNESNNKLIDSLAAEKAVVKSVGGIGKVYPEDIPLNIAILGDNVICNQKHAHQECLSYLLGLNLNTKILNTKQGYSKCSLAIVNEAAVMTSDLSIAKALQKLDIDVLMLEYGDIELEGYGYGFIGGCCGLIDKNVLAFSGDLDKYKDGNKIYNFLKKHKCECICLSHKKMIDIGGIIPIKQAQYFYV